MVCKCACHRISNIRHVIPCCVSHLKISESMLKSITELSVNDAISQQRQDREALRQKAIQDELESKLQQSTSPGKKEKDLDEDDPNAATPTRPAGSQQTQATNQAAAQPQMIDADAIIDKFNIIRSGRSLNDRDIRDATKQYLGSLTPQQLKAVFGILQQMGQIVQPNVAPRVQAPPEEPSAMKNARLAMLQSKQSAPPTAPAPTPQIQSQPAKRVVPKADEEEDDTPPIKVGIKTTESIKKQMKLFMQE